MAKFIFTVVGEDGTETKHEVDEAQVETPKGWLSPQEAKKSYVPKANVESEIGRRLGSATKKQRADLLNDEEFRTEFFSLHNVPVDESGNVSIPEGGMTAEDFKERMQSKLASERKKWEDKVLKEVSEERDTWAKRSEQLLEQNFTALNSKYGEEAGVLKNHFTTLPGIDSSKAQAHQIRPLFDYDWETGVWARKDGDSYVTSTEEGRTYEDMRDYWAELGDTAGAEDREIWFGKTKRVESGPRLNRSKNGSAKTITRSEFDAMPPAEKTSFGALLASGEANIVD